MKIKRSSRHDADSFISLPEKMVLDSHKPKKPIAKNHKALLWLASHLISDQLKLSFLVIQSFSSFRLMESRELSMPRTQPVFSYRPSLSRVYQFNPSIGQTRPTQVESISASQISENTTATLLASALHRVFVSCLKKSWNHLKALPLYRFSPLHQENPAMQFKELIDNKPEGIYLHGKKSLSSNGRFKTEPQLVKAPIKSVISRSSKDSAIKAPSGENYSRKIEILLRNLCKASRLKTFTCFKHLSSFTNQGVALLQLLGTSKTPTVSDLRILKSLHKHWLSLMPETQNNQTSKRKTAAFTKMMEVILAKIMSVERKTFTVLRLVSEEQKNHHSQVLLALQKALKGKLRISFMRLTSLKRTVKFQRLHQKMQTDSRTIQISQKQYMAPQRVALLAKYFGGEKLIKIFNKKLSTVFHTIRRHSAIENFRGFYSNWWHWKIANVKAKNHTELRAHFRELSEEKSLRMQSEERLTKWMSNTSHQAQESQVNGVETRNQGFYLPKRDIQMNTDREKRPETNVIFGSKKMIKRASVSSSIESRRAVGAGEEKPFCLVSSLNQNSIGFKTGTQGKSSSLERSAQKFPFFPLESINAMFFKGNSQKAPESKLNLARNFSFTNQATKITSCSLVDHFKLKLKEPRKDLLKETSSFKESTIGLEPPKLELPSAKAKPQRLSKTTEEWRGQPPTSERLQTEPTDDSKAMKIDSQFEFSQTSSSRRFMKSAVQTLETPRTAEFPPSSRSKNQTLLELWTTRRLKNY